MEKSIDAIVMNQKDNVAVALKNISSGSAARTSIGEDTFIHTVIRDIPSGHKFAISPIREGKEVIKYGESIGKATRDISAGDHVHVHNLVSQRGRGDLKQ